MKELCRKEVEIAIKLHQSDIELMKRFNMAEEKFGEQMSKIYPKKELNAKLKKLRENRKKEVVAVVEEKKEETKEEKEARLSEETIALTNELKEIKKKRAKVRMEISNKRDVAEELYEKLAALKPELETLQKKEEELTNLYNSKVPIHNQKQEELEAVRKEIEESKRLDIYFYNYDNIECKRELSVEGWREIKEELEEKKELGFIQVNQLKNLAYISAIIKNLPEGLEIQWSFEDNELEELMKHI